MPNNNETQTNFEFQIIVGDIPFTASRLQKSGLASLLDDAQKHSGKVESRKNQVRQMREVDSLVADHFKKNPEDIRAFFINPHKTLKHIFNGKYDGLMDVFANNTLESPRMIKADLVNKLLEKQFQVNLSTTSYKTEGRRKRREK